jgi:hypothetical protein
VPYPSAGARVVFDIERFAAEDANRPLEGAAANEVGLVVYRDPMGAGEWPCRLWRVGDLADAVPVTPMNKWLRCTAFTVYEELPGWLVMGPRGDAVVAVIAQIRSLTSENVNAIAALDGHDEQRLYKAAWESWLEIHESGSPVGSGLSAVTRAIADSARRTGEDVFAWDENDEVEVLADPAWLQARQAALAAAISLAAPQLLSSRDNELLARRWTTVLGPPVRESGGSNPAT